MQTLNSCAVLDVVPDELDNHNVGQQRFSSSVRFSSEDLPVTIPFDGDMPFSLSTTMNDAFDPVRNPSDLESGDKCCLCDPYRPPHAEMNCCWPLLHPSLSNDLSFGIIPGGENDADHSAELS